MTNKEIIQDSEAPAFLVATFEARTALHQGRGLQGMGINAIRPRHKVFQIHEADDEEVILDPEPKVDLHENEPAAYPSDETLIPPLEFTTRHGGRVLLRCEETDNSVEVLPDGSVGLLPPETILLEMALRADMPLTIL